MTSAIEHLHVQANGINFRVAVSGPKDGPAILCLHGFPEGSMGWRPLYEAMPQARIYAPDLRGYPGTDQPRHGYDVFTLTDDVKALIEALQLDRPLLVTHDWGGALGWIFAHRYSSLISRLVVVNCTHPRTLVRAVFHFDDWQTFRIPWVPFFELPWIPEAFISSPRLVENCCDGPSRRGKVRTGTWTFSVVDEMVARFQKPVRHASVDRLLSRDGEYAIDAKEARSARSSLQNAHHRSSHARLGYGRWCAVFKGGFQERQRCWLRS